MASALAEYELEGLGEFESEFESELEGESELESEFESELEMPEMFGWGDVKNWASNQWQAVSTPGTWQRRALLDADKAALTAAGTLAGTAIGAEPGAVIGGILGSAAGGALVPDQELEGELEFEAMGEINPVSKVYSDAMMEHLAHAAMEAETEHEAAEGFLPLIPLVASKLLPLAAKALPRIAGKVLPRIARTVTRSTPRLVRGVTNITRVLHRNPRTRPLIRAVPSIARRTVATIARQAASGRPVTPQAAVRILARQNHRVLGNPRMVRSILNRSNLMDRRYHRLSGLPWQFGRRPGVGSGPYGAWGGTYGGRAYGPGGRAVYGPGAYGAPARFCPRCGTTTVVVPRSVRPPVIVVR
jgi:hypothetical protein